MAGETIITLVGNLTADPELRFTQSGVGVANFTVASTPRAFDKASGEWKDGDALFMRCNVWRQVAENVAESLKRGDRVLVTGRLRQRSFEHEGQKRTVMELEVDEVGPSLRYATAPARKVGREVGTPAGGFGQGAARQAARAAGPDARNADAWAGDADPWASNPPRSGGGGYGGFADEPPF